MNVFDFARRCNSPIKIYDAHSGKEAIEGFYDYREDTRFYDLEVLALWSGIWNVPGCLDRSARSIICIAIYAGIEDNKEKRNPEDVIRRAKIDQMIEKAVTGQALTHRNHLRGKKQ